MVERGDFPWGEISPNLGEQLVLLFFSMTFRISARNQMWRKQNDIFLGGFGKFKIAPSLFGWLEEFINFGCSDPGDQSDVGCSQKSPLAIGWFPKSHGSIKLRTAMPLVSSGFPIFRNPLLQLWFDPKNPTCVKSHFFRAKMPFFASKSSAEPAAMSPGPRMLPLLPSWAQPKALEVFRFAHYAFKLGGSDGWVNSLLTGGHVLAKIVGIRKSVLKNAMSARGWTSLDSQR